MTHNVDHKGLEVLPEALLPLLIHLTKVVGHSSSNGPISLQVNIPFLKLRGCSKSDILHIIWVLSLPEMTQCGPWGACTCCQKHLWQPLYNWWRLWVIEAPMDVYPCNTVCHFPCWDWDWEGAQSLTFCMKFDIYIDRNDTMLTMRGLYMLYEALEIILYI